MFTTTLDPFGNRYRRQLIQNISNSIKVPDVTKLKDDIITDVNQKINTKLDESKENISHELDAFKNNVSTDVDKVRKDQDVTNNELTSLKQKVNDDVTTVKSNQDEIKNTVMPIEKVYSAEKNKIEEVIANLPPMDKGNLVKILNSESGDMNGTFHTLIYEEFCNSILYSFYKNSRSSLFNKRTYIHLTDCINQVNDDDFSLKAVKDSFYLLIYNPNNDVNGTVYVQDYSDVDSFDTFEINLHIALRDEIIGIDDNVKNAFDLYIDEKHDPKFIVIGFNYSQQELTINVGPDLMELSTIITKGIVRPYMVNVLSSKVECTVVSFPPNQILSDSIISENIDLGELLTDCLNYICYNYKLNSLFFFNVQVNQPVYNDRLDYIDDSITSIVSMIPIINDHSNRINTLESTTVKYVSVSVDTTTTGGTAEEFSIVSTDFISCDTSGIFKDKIGNTNVNLSYSMSTNGGRTDNIINDGKSLNDITQLFELESGITYYLTVTLSITSNDVTFIRELNTDIEKRTDSTGTVSDHYTYSVKPDLKLYGEIMYTITPIEVNLYIHGNWAIAPTDVIVTNLPNMNLNIYGTTYTLHPGNSNATVVDYQDLFIGEAYMVKVEYGIADTDPTKHKYRYELINYAGNFISNDNEIKVYSADYNTFGWSNTTVPYNKENLLTNKKGEMLSLKANVGDKPDDYSLNLFGIIKRILDIPDMSVSIGVDKSQLSMSFKVPSLPGKLGRVAFENATLRQLYGVVMNDHFKLEQLELGTLQIKDTLEYLSSALDKIQDNLVNKKNFLYYTSTSLNIVGMITVFIYPPVGAAMLCVAATLNVIEDVRNNSSWEVILTDSVNAVGFLYVCAHTSGVDFKGKIKAVTDSIKGNSLIQLEKLNSVIPSVKWLKVMRKSPKLAQQFNMDAVNLRGTVEIHTHTYTPDKINKFVTDTTVEKIRNKRGPLIKGLRKINLAPEHSKVILQHYDEIAEGIIKRDVHIFGVSDFSENVLSEHWNEGMKVGSISVSGLYDTNTGNFNAYSYKKMGYTEEQARMHLKDMNIVNYDTISSEKVLTEWNKLSRSILDGSYSKVEGDTTLIKKAVPLPIPEISTWLRDYFNNAGAIKEYNVLRYNCQHVANGIYDLVNKGTRPTWMPVKEYLDLCRTVGSSIQ